MQETWFDEEIRDIEIVKNSNYTLFRQDRKDTFHQKQGGGGIATLIKSDIKAKRHIFTEIRTLQYICLELNISKSIVFLINIYSPFGHMKISIEEFGLLMNLIEPLQKDTILIVGDFNMPTIEWLPDTDLPGVFLPMGKESDEPFIDVLFENDLRQIAEPPLGRNHLDLALVSDEKTTHCTYPIEEEMLDRISVRHAPFILNYQIATDILDEVFEFRTY